MSGIVLQGIRRSFGNTHAVKETDFTFPDGSVTCLLGPSGCGKTTLMRMIAGLEMPSAGQILFDGRDVTAWPARRRDVAMVFQYPVMYRTLTVEQNIALALDNARIPRVERRTRIEAVIDVMQLGDCRRLGIDALDIGTRQRVAVARAIARDCAVILFDEPTTNIEMHAKLQLIRAFKQYRSRLRETITPQTVIYVTHDQTEAMTLADRIALMRDGAITQCADPRTLYDRPDSEFGGWFMGNPGMNFLVARADAPGRVAFDCLPASLAAPDGELDGLRLGIRPERVIVGSAGCGGVPGRVLRRTLTVGGQSLLLLEVGQSTMRARMSASTIFDRGDAVSVQCSADHIVLFRNGSRLSMSPETIEAA
jgi:ABC-type sugar transport system ATPase subunit